MRLTATCLLLTLLAASVVVPAQEEQPRGTNEQEASDFVIGLHALNRQILDALEQQPGRRVIVLQFVCDVPAYDKLCQYITEQLVTSVAAGRNYEIVDPAPLADLIKRSSIDPMDLGSNPEFRQSSRIFASTTIISGKVTPLGSRCGVMARLFNGESGRMVGGAQVYLAVAQEIGTLTGQDLAPKAVVVGKAPEEAGTEKETVTEETAAQTRQEVEAEEPGAEPKEDSTAAPAGLEGRGDKSIYDEAYADCSAGRYTRAVMLFDYLVSKYPESPLADNALYWIAECQYARKNWAEALVAFHRVLTEYPYGNKVPAALLKVAYTEELLGHLQEAIAALEELISRFENSPEAELGKRKLQLLRAAQQ
jgi:tol-pal system protein YbgF